MRASKGATEEALAPHDVHPESDADLYVPAAQSVQACASVPVLPAAEDFPAGHVEHEGADVATVPVASYLPEGQAWRE